jgi:signal transduction histidine kinase
MTARPARLSGRPAQRGWNDFSTGQLISMGLLAMLIVFLVAGVCGTVTLMRASSLTDDLIDRVSPARGTSQQLQLAMLNQQTGLDGYIIGRDQVFLRPYQQGMADEQTALRGLRGLLRGRSTDLALVDAVEQSGRTWRTQYAEPVIADIGAGRTPIATNRIDQGKALFDRVRAATQALSDRLTAERVRVRAQVNVQRAERNWTLVAIMAAFLVISVAFGLLLRNGVLRPLQKVGTATRRVSQGDFGHRIDARGPADIQAVARDIEGMRQRLAAELAFATEARQRLEEQAAELTRSNTELEQFAYVASHDLQEPLRKVASFCELLDRRYNDALDERGKQYIAFAVDGAQRMQVLINDLLTFSRVGRLHDKQVEVDLDTSLSRALDAISRRLEEESATVNRPADLPTVVGEPTLMTMLFQNLVNNAVKFRRPDTPPVIDIAVHRSDSEWEFAVTDNGIGIDPQFSDKIFVIFQRLHTRDAYGGTGIGLALCKKIVEYHGGRIWLDTDYAEGARLRFTLPVRAEDLAEPEPEPEREPEPEPEPESQPQPGGEAQSYEQTHTDRIEEPAQ